MYFPVTVGVVRIPDRFFLLGDEDYYPGGEYAVRAYEDRPKEVVLPDGASLALDALDGLEIIYNDRATPCEGGTIKVIGLTPKEVTLLGGDFSKVAVRRPSPTSKGYLEVTLSASAPALFDRHGAVVLQAGQTLRMRRQVEVAKGDKLAAQLRSGEASITLADLDSPRRA